MQASASSDVLARGFCAAFVLATLAGGCAALSSSPVPKAPRADPPEEKREPPARLPDARIEKLPEAWAEQLVAAQKRNVQAYECANAFRFSALMERDTVRLRLPERRLALARVWAMDGAKYRGGPALFWKKGQRNALLRAGGTRHPDCRRAPQRDAWAAARWRGVDLRAVGNEPRWHLDLQDGDYMLLTTGYGRSRIAVPAPVPDTARVAGPADQTTTGRAQRPETSPEERPKASPQRLIYEVETAEHALTVTVTDTLCHDAVRGEHYPKHVAVELGERRYVGCGRRLP
jgi:membrane-bound inhibitor of C-type lysozyme/uncharacterized membrane protein